ncbi:MAG TPA: hypothetical protein VMJ65_27570 [Solirubrobacteraceae bacterium]|nr:hypothetical protein [Solirubrobacteraceae bacterium]
MTRAFLALLWPIALLPWLVATTPIAGAAPAPHSQTLFFDAVFTRARTAGPGVTHVGHRQIVTGVLRDASGRRAGTFSFTCTWTKVERGRASESCVASASTPDGRLDATGPSRSNSVTHTWRLTGGTGLYRDASGTVSVRDLGEREALLSLAVITSDNTSLHTGKVARPPANDAFIARANGLCERAAAELASLPPFPFEDFDPLHPDVSTLPAVGAFFTGAGDPRPTFGALDAGLRELGPPAGERAVWRQALRAHARELAVINEQDRAALAGDVAAFVQSVHHTVATFRQIAITATVFGATHCIL